MKETVKKRAFLIFSAFIVSLYIYSQYGERLSCFWQGVNLPHSVGLILLSALVCLYMGSMTKKTYACEKVFLVLWILMSVMYFCSSPLFNVPDEYHHFFRAFEISSGKMVSEVKGATEAGSMLPTGVAAVSPETIHISWENFYENIGLELGNETVFIGYANTASYCPVSYIPQALGISFMRIVTDNVFAIAYGGRVANWLAITAILYWAIKILPSGKAALAMIALTPMNISESISMAPDGMVVAISALMVAKVLRIRASRQMLRKKDFVALYCLAAAISLYKIVYLPFCVIYFLIPEECCGGKRKKIIHAILIALLAGMSNLLWLNIARRFLIIDGTDSAAQIHSILSNPFNYLLVIIRTWFTYGSSWLYQTLGSSLGWLDVSVGDIFIVIYGIMLVAEFSCANKTTGRDEMLQLNCAVLIICIALLTSTALYVQWTEPYASMIEGIQGRYFLPLLLPLYFAFNPRRDPVSGENLSVYQTCVIAGVNICANIALLSDALAL